MQYVVDGLVHIPTYVRSTYLLIQKESRGMIFAPFMNANNLNNTFIFSTKTRSFLTRKKKYQILLATYQQPLQFAMFLVQHLKTTFAK